MSNFTDSDPIKLKSNDYRVHRYEIVLVSLKDVSASSPEDAIESSDLDLSKTIDRTLSDHDHVISIKYSHLKPISFIVEPIEDGLPDYRNLTHYASDENGRIYQLKEPFTTKSDEASRLVERIADISTDALSSKNYSSVLMAIIREARNISERHSV